MKWSYGARSTIVNDLGEKFTFLKDSALPQAIRFYGPWVQSKYLLIAIVIFIVIGMATLISWSFYRFFLLIGVIVIGASPSIISAENWQSNRSLLMPEWFFCLFMLIGLFSSINKLRLSHFYEVAIVFCLLGSIYNGLWLSNYLWRDPQLREIAISKEAISVETCKVVTAIRPSGWYDSIAPFTNMDEFGFPHLRLHETLLDLRR